MKKIFVIITAGLLFSFTGTGQDTGGKQKSQYVQHKKHKKAKKHYTRLNNPGVKKQATTDGQPPKVTDLHNSGSSNGTMASNNDPGKVTTNPNKSAGTAKKKK